MRLWLIGGPMHGRTHDGHEAPRELDIYVGAGNVLERDTAVYRCVSSERWAFQFYVFDRWR